MDEEETAEEAAEEQPTSSKPNGRVRGRGQGRGRGRCRRQKTDDAEEEQPTSSKPNGRGHGSGRGRGRGRGRGKKTDDAVPVGKGKRGKSKSEPKALSSRFVYNHKLCNSREEPKHMNTITSCVKCKSFHGRKYGAICSPCTA